MSPSFAGQTTGSFIFKVNKSLGNQTIHRWELMAKLMLHTHPPTNRMHNHAHTHALMLPYWSDLASSYEKSTSDLTTCPAVTNFREI